MKTTCIKITKEFTTLKEAVAASAIDLSYNPQSAAEYIERLDREHRGSLGVSKVTRAFLMESGEVWYVYSCDINLLHKFEPFHGMISDSPFNPATIREGIITIFEELRIPKTHDGRYTFQLHKDIFAY